MVSILNVTGIKILTNNCYLHNLWLLLLHWTRMHWDNLRLCLQLGGCCRCDWWDSGNLDSWFPWTNRHNFCSSCCCLLSQCRGCYIAISIIDCHFLPTKSWGEPQRWQFIRHKSSHRRNRWLSMSFNFFQWLKRFVPLRCWRLHRCLYLLHNGWLAGYLLDRNLLRSQRLRG